VPCPAKRQPAHFQRRCAEITRDLETSFRFVEMNYPPETHSPPLSRRLDRIRKVRSSTERLEPPRRLLSMLISTRLNGILAIPHNRPSPLDPHSHYDREPVRCGRANQLSGNGSTPRTTDPARRLAQIPKMMQNCPQCGDFLPTDARFCPRCGAPQIGVRTDPLVGKVIAERYLLLHRIGQGSTGTIYRAEHTTLGRKVAIKLLHHQLSHDEHATERFRREATTVGEIDNEHVLQVLDFGRSEDRRLFIAMELLEGETLAQVIKRERQLDFSRTVAILVQIGNGLMEAHGLGYIHRDLRPGNIFLTQKRGQKDFVKLLDFGLAKYVQPNLEDQQTALGVAFGDPRYMSPEQARGDRVDRRTDIYALGVLAFEMLTARPPFIGKSPFEVVRQVVEAPAPSVRAVRPDCPPWLDAAVSTALAKSPEHRFVTVLKFLERLKSGVAPSTQQTTAVISTRIAAQIARDPPGVEPRPSSTTVSTDNLSNRWFVESNERHHGRDEQENHELPKRGLTRVIGIGTAVLAIAGAGVLLLPKTPTTTLRARYLVLLGQAYSGLGRPREAADEYKKALELEPGNREARRFLDVVEPKLE
jgi:serine/threonine protein kinase